METPALETENLILRPISLDDAPAIQKYFNNWNIIRNLSTIVPWPYPDDGAETFIRDIALPKVETGESHIWVIVPKDGPDEAIGVVDYHEIIDDGGSRGNWLAEPFHGRGYMTEAITAIQDFLFFEAGIDRMVIVNAKINNASSRVQQKTGGRFIGTGHLEHHNGETEIEKWEVTRESWAAFRGLDL